MQSKPELEVIRPVWDAPENVVAFFTLREGGMSAGPYRAADGFCGLNLGNHVGDNKYAVQGNRRIVTDMLPSVPRWLTQIHSSRVICADGNLEAAEADAEWTTESGVPCVVMTADCVPILLCDTEGKSVAAVHAGWRGLADGVIQNTIEVLKKEIGEKAEFLAWIGPHIRRAHFEVKGDVVNYYRESILKNLCEDAIEEVQEGLWHLDLARFAREALRQGGVEAVSDCELDTYSDPKLFYSYRRDKETGRHGAFIFKR